MKTKDILKYGGNVMNILAIDTTTKVASTTLRNDNNEIFEESISNEITHSEKFLPLIDKLLTKQNISLKDISVFAVINGPGSFTGIRIGLSTIKAFSFVYNQKIFSINSDKLISYKAYKMINTKKPLYIASLIDAKNDRVYYSIYKISTNKNDKIEIEEKLAISNNTIDVALNDIHEYLTNNDITHYENVVFAGNVINQFKNIISDMFNNSLNNLLNIYPTPTDAIYAYSDILDIESYMFDAFTLDAVYARKSQAERLKNNE